MALMDKGKKGKGGDEDEGEDLFLPLAEALRKLKAGPLNFGVYQTNDKDNPVLLAAHKRKDPSVLGKKVKKEAGTPKGAFGKLTLESGALVFACENDDPPAGLKKKIRAMLKAEGYAKFKPRILLPGGGEIGEEGDDDDDAPETAARGGRAAAGDKGGAGGKGADPAAEKEKAAAVAALAEVRPPLQQMAAGDDEKAADQAGRLLKLLAAAEGKEDWKKVTATAKVARKLVEAGGVETAERRLEAAETEADAADDRAEDTEEETLRDVRGQLAGVPEELAALRKALAALETDLAKALGEAETLAERQDKGEAIEADRMALRKRATQMKDRLDRLGDDVAALEKKLAKAGQKAEDLPESNRLKAMRSRVEALEKAVEQAEAVEAEVDEALEAAAEDPAGS